METYDTANASEKKTMASKWQFSLREVIFATAAVAAIIAVFMQNQPRETSVMARQFDPLAMLNQIVRDEGLQGRVFRSSGSGGSSPSSIGQYHEMTVLDISDSDVKSVLMPTLRSEIETAILDEGYSRISDGVGGSKNKTTGVWERVTNFRIGYEGRRIRGQIRVLTSYDVDGRSTLIITLDEN